MENPRAIGVQLELIDYHFDGPSRGTITRSLDANTLYMAGGGDNGACSGRRTAYGDVGHLDGLGASTRSTYGNSTSATSAFRRHNSLFLGCAGLESWWWRDGGEGERMKEGERGRGPVASKVPNHSRVLAWDRESKW